MGSPECRQDQPHTTIQLHLLGGVGRGLEPPSFLAQVSSACPTLCPQIQDSEHIKVENSEQGSKLTIRAARQEHCGCYTLLVENKLGSSSSDLRCIYPLTPQSYTLVSTLEKYCMDARRRVVKGCTLKTICSSENQSNQNNHRKRES